VIAVDHPSSSVEALYATGHWLLGAERFADAAIVFRTMALAAPTDERAWLALGACHEGIGQLKIAASLYELASAAAAPALRCTIARARLLRALGRDDEALDTFERARELALEQGDDALVAVVDHDLRAAS
jgi:tetratricopeptide (TPR) repeat protein